MEERLNEVFKKVNESKELMKEDKFLKKLFYYIVDCVSNDSEASIDGFYNYINEEVK